MSVEIRLIGFGEERPPQFDARNRLQVATDTPVSVRRLLQLAGVDEAPDLIAMDAETVIPPADWDTPRINDESTLTLLSAIEGG